MVTHCKLRKLTTKQKDSMMAMMGMDKFALDQMGFEILELFAHIATGSASTTEIAAVTNILDAVDVPVLLAVRSTSASDTDAAGGHARKVQILGWGTGTASSGTTVLQEETIALNGLTPVSSTLYWERLLHFEVILWGTGGKDAAGELQIVDMTHAGYTAEKTTITATNALLLADADWFQFSDFNASTQTSTRFNVWFDKSGSGSAPTLTGTEVEVDISSSEVKQACTIVAKAPGVPEVATIVAKAPGVAEVATITAKAPGAAGVYTIVAKAPGVAGVQTITAKAFGTAEVQTVVADTFANIVDGTYFTIHGLTAAFVDTEYYCWFDKVGDSSGKPTASGTEVELDISGDVTAQDVSDLITAVIDALGPFGAANGAGASTTVTITNAVKGGVTDAADVDTGLAVTTTVPGVTNMPDGSYFVMYGVDATTHVEKGYYCWFDKQGGSEADPAPGGGLTAIRFDISADVTVQDVAECMHAAINALGNFGSSEDDTDVTVTNAVQGAITAIADVDSTLTLVETTPGTTNIPDGSYFKLYGIDSTTKAEEKYYCWFDYVGDSSGDPAVAAHTGVEFDISAATTAQGVSDIITAILHALDDITAANGGGASTTCTATNGIIGASTNITDEDTGLTVASTTPGTLIIGDGTYITLQGITHATKATKNYYLWFDWIGDSSGDPAPGGTGIEVDMSSLTSIKHVADAISVAVDAIAEFGCADDDTTCTITNASIGTVTDAADVDTTMTVATTTPGTLVIPDGSYITLQGITHATKAVVDYYLWFDWVGDESADPAPGTRTAIKCDISDDTSIANVSDCIQVAIDAVANFGATDDGTTTTITCASIGTVTNIADVDTTLTVATTTPGTLVIADGTYFTISAINGSGVQVDHYVWFDWIGDESGDPGVAAHTAIKCDISDDTSIATVSDCIQVAMDGATLFDATDNGTTTTATSANEGDCDDIANVDAGLTVATSVQGGSTADEVALAVLTAINNSAALVVAAETTYPEFTVTNSFAGDATDSADGSAATAFTFVKTTDGDGPTEEYLSIAAGTNQSSGSRLYIPDGYQCMIKHVTLRPTIDMGDNTAIVIMTKHSFDNELNTDPDLDGLTLAIWDLLPLIDYDLMDVPREGNDEAYIKFMENYVTASVANDLKVLIFIFG